MAWTLDGARLKAFRESKGMTGPAFAAWLNEKLNRSYDKARISRWENNGEPIPNTVRNLVLTVAAPKSDRAAVVAVANQKGGVGKTTSSTNLCYLAAEAGFRALLIDLDPQGSATMALGIDRRLAKERESGGLTTHGLLCRSMSIDEAKLPVCDGMFDFVATTIKLAEAEIQLAGQYRGDAVIKERVDAARGSYDLIVLDTPPHLSLLTQGALGCADQVLIPCETDELAAMGIPLLLSTIMEVQTRGNPGLRIAGILPTRYDRRTIAAREALEGMQAAFGRDIRVWEPIPARSAYSMATRTAKPVFATDPDVDGGDVYRDILMFVMGRQDAPVQEERRNVG